MTIGSGNSIWWQFDATQQKLVQALAIFGRPVPPRGISFLLQPYLPKLTIARTTAALRNLAQAYPDVIFEETGHFALLEPAPILDSIEPGEPSDIYEAGTPHFTRYVLYARAADYYKTRRKPSKAWTSLDNLAPQMAEIEMRCNAEDYDAAAEVLAEISFNYLLRWGHYRLVVELRERLAPHIANALLAQGNWGELGTAYAYLGDMEKAIDCQEQALAIARQRNDRANEGVWLANLGNRYNNLGRTQRALEYYEQALEIARELGDLRTEGINLGSIAVCYVYLGQIVTAIEHFTQAMMIARMLNDINAEGYFLANLGNIYATLGQVTRAIAMHDQAVAIAQQTGRRVEEARRLGNLAEALVMNNQFGEALESLKQGLQIDDEIGYVRGKSYKYCSLAGVHLFMGDLAAARAAAEMACACDAPQNNHNSQVLLGLIALRQGDTDVALVAFEQCVTLAEELLQHNPQNYDALNSRGLAYSGLALLKRANPDTEYVQAATEAYRAARGINRAAGLVSHSLRLFEELAVMDTGRVLVAVRDVVAQSDA